MKPKIEDHPFPNMQDIIFRLNRIPEVPPLDVYAISQLVMKYIELRNEVFDCGQGDK